APQCRQAYFDDVTERSDQTVALRCADDDQGRLRIEDAPAIRPRPAPGDIEHQVIALPTSGEVLLGVVDDVVRAKRSGDVDVPGAADGGHLRTERLGDLDGERAHASRRTVHQDPGPRLHPPPLTNTA